MSNDSPKPEQLDWRKIFVRYVGIVLKCEGVDFLWESEWSVEEWKQFKPLLEHLTTTFDLKELEL